MTNSCSIRCLIVCRVRGTRRRGVHPEVTTTGFPSAMALLQQAPTPEEVEAAAATAGDDDMEEAGGDGRERGPSCFGQNLVVL